MAASVTHQKVSLIPDAGDATLVEPSDWNATHVLTGVQGTIALTTTGTGAATFDGTILNVPTPAADTGITQLTGEVTAGPGNGSQAAILTNSAVIAKVLTGYASGAGVVAATDTILQAIQKLNGNDATNANLTGPITSVGNATTIASLATGTGLPLTTGVTGILPIANGGTNASTAPNARLNLTVPVYVATRTAMAALSGSTDLVVWLEESPRQGWFQWNSANLSTQVTADTLQGIYVAPASDTTGASGAWVRQYTGALSGAWFGAKIDASTNDTTAWSAALSLASFLGGVAVLHPGGVSLTDELTLAANCQFLGLGAGSILRARSASRSLVNITGSLTRVSGLDFDGNSTGLRAIRISKTADNKKVWIDHNYIASFTTYGIEWTLGDCASITDNVFVNAGVAGGAIQFTEDGRNSDIDGNYILGTSGIHILRTTQGMEGSRIRSNIILPTTGGTYCYTIEAGLEILIEGNIFDQISSGVAGQIIDTHPIANIKSVNNWYGAIPVPVAATYGLYVAGGANGFESIGDTFIGWSQAGIYLNGSSGSHNLSSVIRDAKFYFPLPNVRDILLDYTDNVLIDGCIFNSLAPIVIGASATVTGLVTSNDFRNGTPQALFSGLRYGKQRSGISYTDESESLTATDFVGTNVATAQPVFTTTQDEFTVLPHTMYKFKGRYWISRVAGTTSHNISALFGGTAVVTMMNYVAAVFDPVAGGTILGNTGTAATATQLTSNNATATENLLFDIEGHFSIGATAGTLIPQVKYSAAPGGVPTFKVGTYFRVQPIGLDTMTIVGSWS